MSDLQPINDYKPRPRAADDVDVIAARIAELRKEREEVLQKPAPGPSEEG